jgi:glycosyltransferase involved in cell wall biosynthesis
MTSATLPVRPDRPTLSCVVPAYNEADSLPLFLPRLREALQALTDRFEIVVVNDGSRDATLQVLSALVLQHPEIVVVDLSRNFGKEPAMMAGLEAAAGEVVVLMDADGQHPVELLSSMLQRWREGIDVVYAVRRTRTDQSSLHVLLTGWFYRLINWGNRVKIPPNAGDFRLMDRRVVQALLQLPERNRFMKGLYAWVGFPSEAIDYEPLPRLQGQSHFPLGGALRLALTGTLAFSTVPLRLLTFAGLLLSAGSMLYILSVFYEYFFHGIRVPGYATLVVSIMFFSGIQLLALGVMSEYVGRIYEEVKRRPMFLVRERWGLGLDRDRPDL